MSDARTSLNDDDAQDNGRCPECDEVADWELSRRHRFSPFGSVLLAVLAFWSGVFGWLLGFGYVPALALLVAAVIIGIATRRAEICGHCGYVRPHRH
jgi:hypothetical protein